MKSPSSCSRSRRRRSSRRIRRTGGRSRNRSRGTRYSRSPAPGRSPAGMSSFAEMPNLLALSFEGTLTPAFDLHCLELSRTPPDGWGIACYPGGEPAALGMKEAAPSHGSIRSALVSAWERLESSIFLVHIRTATWGAITEANTQPFQRAWGRPRRAHRPRRDPRASAAPAHALRAGRIHRQRADPLRSARARRGEGLSEPGGHPQSDVAQLVPRSEPARQPHHRALRPSGPRRLRRSAGGPRGPGVGGGGPPPATP